MHDVQSHEAGNQDRPNIPVPLLLHLHVAIGDRLRTALEAIEVFDARAGVENHYALADVDLSGRAKFFKRRKTGRAFRRNEEAFLEADFANSPNHFVVINCDRAAF